MAISTDFSTSNLVSVEPGAIREDTPPGSVIQYSDYELDYSSEFAGGAAWIEGEYVPASEARISIFDTGFGHSDLTYTVAHVWHGNIFRLDDHLDRLLDGAHKLRLEPGLTKDELAEITKRCVALSQLRESFVNLTLTRGYGKRKGEKDLSKLNHQVYIYAIPYLWAFPPAEQIFGTTAIVPRHVRRAGRNTVDPTIKNYQWGDLTAASFEAKDRGARTAILLDADNCVAEGPGFNVVIVKDGKLFSPSRNALPGITRKTVFEIADAMGVEATLCDVTSRELYDADELMAVTTAGGVTPIVSLDGDEFGDGGPGPLTLAIRDRFWALMDEPSPLIEAIDY
ncbi:aminotransferase class IV [Mycobacterium sp. shizuoka-1]|uniref:aminotransferase class IV n=1 Tax=Mycobacterium sp. shizuoka-1 TaxID=2039281 RepID=UPI000C061B61|nr:aminotransferase class IV [Mycobacterium sp. shizuoka-1]GAY13538.1 branched-chain amino acid transferase [Mycobacterium sp. shizuoka-1]